MPNSNSGNTKLLIGKEYPPADEVVYIDRMIEDLKTQLEKQYPAGIPTLRQAHPKMHGCVNAEFIVNEGLAPELRIGVFKEPVTFPAYIRFSNAKNFKQHDSKKDVRGMAIKLFDVPGKKLMEKQKEALVQDFLLINHYAFLSKSVKDFQQVIRALTKGPLSMLGYMLNPAHFSFVKGFISSSKKCSDVLNTEYWSTTPYLFGESNAVKYYLAPANEIPLNGVAENKDENYLRTNMIKTLAERDVFFDFYIQFQTDAEKMPIEDATVRWDSPFTKVAKIRIPKQEFDTPARDTLGTDFSFSPWHSLHEHRPLGGLNRARKKIYEVMAAFWHSRNTEYTPEP